METFIGTSGYSYPEWKGAFYPPKTSAPQMLGYYSSVLRSVEINNTFYRMPRSSVLEGWASQVPLGFRFAIKATRRITHFKKLKDLGELLPFVTSALGSLGQTLGPLLFQLPPTMRVDVPLLRDFLHQLPPRISLAGPEDPAPAFRPAEPRSGEAPTSSSTAASVPLCGAFEFRHRSWFCDDTYEALSSAGAALVGGDWDEEDKSPPFIKTGEFLYLRLRKADYASAELEQWADRILGAGVHTVYGYFKHEVAGPELAQRLTALLGQSTAR